MMKQKKKGFKLYRIVEMPSRHMKVKVVNISGSCISLFSGKKLIQNLDAFDAKTF